MDIDKISKELYEYIVSKPYGTEVSTSSCLRELYNLESEYIDQYVGWILTNGELKLSDMELFDIDAKLHKLIRESGTYFIDSTRYVGACVGLPFNVGGILKTYDGLVDEFKRRKTRDYGGYYVKGPVKGGWHQHKYLVRIPPQAQLRLEDFGKLEQVYYKVTHGVGKCQNETIKVGDSDFFGSQWSEIPEGWSIENNSEEELIIYFVTMY